MISRKAEDALQTPEPIVIPMEDPPLHTEESPFCLDPTCGCHEDPTLSSEVARQVEDGLLTPQEATRLVAGRQL